MSVTLPLWLVISQWVLLFALGFLILTMYRQVGLQMRLRDMGTDREGLAIGGVAPGFEYFPAQDYSKSIPIRFEPKGSWSLILFADPGCVSCEGALSELERFVPKLGNSVRLFVATSAEPAQIAAIDAFKKTSLPISRVSHDVPYKLFRTLVTPFVFLIDPEGIIRAKGFATDEKAFRKIVQKVHRSAIAVVPATL